MYEFIVKFKKFQNYNINSIVLYLLIKEKYNKYKQK